MDNVTTRTIEEKVSDAILQQPIGKITLRGIEYPINHPSPATLIMVSQICANFPYIDSKGNILTEVLRTASDFRLIGRVVATLILGAKRIKEYKTLQITRTRPKRSSWRRFLGLPDKHITVTEKVSEIEYLSEVIMEELTPSQLRDITQELFFYSEVTDFFGLSTSLYVTNLIKRTKEVETVFGE